MSEEYSVEETLKKLEEATIDALIDMSEEIRDYAKDEVPFDTGNLFYSIDYLVDLPSMESEIGSDVEYAPYVELRTHFLQKAADKTKSRINKIYADAIKRKG